MFQATCSTIYMDALLSFFKIWVNITHQISINAICIKFRSYLGMQSKAFDKSMKTPPAKYLLLSRSFYFSTKRMKTCCSSSFFLYAERKGDKNVFLSAFRYLFFETFSDQAGLKLETSLEVPLSRGESNIILASSEKTP